MKFFVISYENGETRYGEFADYADALHYAKKHNSGWNFTIEEYNSEDDYADALYYAKKPNSGRNFTIEAYDSEEEYFNSQ